MRTLVIISLAIIGMFVGALIGAFIPNNVFPDGLGMFVGLFGGIIGGIFLARTFPRKPKRTIDQDRYPNRIIWRDH